MVDFHTHVLPGMDDGAADETVSINMINELIAQGVQTIVCTPHFYPYEETITEFNNRREESMSLLKTKSEDMDDLKLLLGAEVYCHEMLEYINDFSSLCIENTSVILLELPFVSTLSARVMKLIRRLSIKYSLTVVIAHAERYKKIAIMPINRIRKLKKLGCLIQINSSSVINPKIYPMIKKLIAKELVDIIASDSHDMGKRPPFLKEAYEKIQKDFGMKTVDTLKNNAHELISGTITIKGMGDDRVFF